MKLSIVLQKFFRNKNFEFYFFKNVSFEQKLTQLDIQPVSNVHRCWGEIHEHIGLVDEYPQNISCHLLNTTIRKN